jgi:two-component system sensor histidine kinase UhpB
MTTPAPAAAAAMTDEYGSQGTLHQLELPALVMRRALLVAALCLCIVLLLGVARARSDTLREMQGSLDLAIVNKVLAGLHESSPDEGLRQLRTLPGLRHLRLELCDETGAVAAALGDEDSSAWLTQKWQWLSATIGISQPTRQVAYAVPLRDGRLWTAVLTASPDSEILEAASNLTGLFLLMLACCGAMLAAMHWIVRRSLQPLRTLVDAIAGVERHELAAVKALPRMPIRELEAIAQALRHLAAAQERSELGRRVLAHRLMSLQEDERQRLARDLHDEFGQRLTALRVDASWLQRISTLPPQAQRVVEGMLEQVALIQNDVRRLLARLRPLGVTPSGVDLGPQTLGRLRSMLVELGAGWSAAGAERGPRVELQIDPRFDEQALGQDLALGLYRITQEALTNVMRHAGATRCRVEVAARSTGSTGCVVEWRVTDDGCGLADFDAALRRGTGLAGLKDRIWALGGTLEAAPGIGGAGLALRAKFSAEPGAPH